MKRMSHWLQWNGFSPAVGGAETTSAYQLSFRQGGSSVTTAHTGVNEDVSLQMVVGPECGVTVNADVTLGVLDAQQSIFVRVEDLQPAEAAKT